MHQAGALLKKSLVNSHVRWPTAWREARKLSEHRPYQIVWAFATLDYYGPELGARIRQTRKIGDTSFGPAHYEQ